MSPAEITLAFLAFAIVMFFWEKIPLVTTAMTCAVGLIVTGVTTPKAGFLGLVDSNVILFGGMFIVGGAFFQTGMADKVGEFVNKVAKTERQVIVAVMLVTGFMSGMLSNTGTAAVLIPVVIGIASKAGFRRSRLLMPIVVAAALGGNMSLVGSPPNMLAQSALNSVGESFGFFEYAYIGVPMVLVSTAFYATIGFRFLPVNDTGMTGGDGKVVVEDADAPRLDFSKVPEWKKTGALVVLFGTVIAMVFEKQLGIPLYVTAVIGALVLIMTGIIGEKEALKSIDLQTVFLFGGMLSLASAMEKTGAGKMVADVALSFMGDDPSPMMVMFVIMLATATLTNFMSNTASAAIFCPIGLSIAKSLGASPKAVLMSIVVAASLCFLTPVGSPPNTMVLGLGGYRFVDYIKSTLPVFILCFALALIILPIVFPFYP